jgi:hypothetical protein
MTRTIRLEAAGLVECARGTSRPLPGPGGKAPLDMSRARAIIPYTQQSSSVVSISGWWETSD